MNVIEEAHTVEEIVNAINEVDEKEANSIAAEYALDSCVEAFTAAEAEAHLEYLQECGADFSLYCALEEAERLKKE